MAVRPMKIGVVGCGNISSAYLEIQKRFPVLDVVALSDLNMDRAGAQAEKYGIPRACRVEELLQDPQIEIILNLTTPAAHTEVNLAALNAGKHVYLEKPLAIELEDARKVLALAKEKNLRVGCAPDTFLGAGHQTARKLLDDGWIGRPVAAAAFMTCRGHESWHPNAEFYYETGGGPMFDMGPYYLTDLVQLLGPARRVCGSAQKSFPTRTMTVDVKYGKVIPVNVPTHVAGTVDFVNGAVATVIMSFDVVSSSLPCIEIYGEEGTLTVPNPNSFGEEVFVNRQRKGEKTKIPYTHNYPDNSRSLGLADMAHAIQSGRPHRASGELAYHVLELFHAFHIASDIGKYYDVQSTVERPAPMAMGLLPGILDE
ncbi:MAG: Gfo/Idh/MocA family oxidoreductase [Phycisphaerae bacterium]|nr:Gfo/Idh/MocA family oxidoreductase [Phycisphaerae bacterium]